MENASAKPPHLPSASRALDLWPPDPQSLTFHAELPRGPPVSTGFRIGSFVFKFGSRRRTDERTDGRTHGGTNGQFENIMLPPPSLAWWRRKKRMSTKYKRHFCVLWIQCRRSHGRSGRCGELDDSYADGTLQVPEKSQYATAALVRHLGGSMVVRAADQLQWDVGEPRLYGSAVNRGTTTGSTANGAAYGDEERPTGLHHLTARVYPPPLDYCVGGGSAGHQLYCRAACGCDTYAAAVGSAPDYVETSAGSRRRVHDRDCTAKLRVLTAPVGGVDSTSSYGGDVPVKRRRHPGRDAAETTANGRQLADVEDSAWSMANTRAGGTSDGVGRPNALYDQPSDGPTSPAPGTTTSAGSNLTVPELVTDCSLATNSSNHSVQGTASMPLYGRSSS